MWESCSFHHRFLLTEYLSQMDPLDGAIAWVRAAID